MRRTASIIVGIAVLTSCVTVINQSPPRPPTASPIASATPYVYPDLPAQIEDTIAEGDCEEVETVRIFMDRDSVDPEVRELALEAIEHREEELGC